MCKYKLLSKSHLSFCATDGIKKGQTPGDVFELMLQEVQGVTPSAAAGIRTEFSSFKVLMDAYEKAERKGRERAELMLQDCEVGPYLFYEVELMAD
jgi:crossover junction endonuclease EME1